MASVLDNPAWSALTGPQQHLGTVRGDAARFDPLFTVFGALADVRDVDAWADLAAVTEPGGEVALITPDPVGNEPAFAVGPGWTVAWEGPGVQMIADGVDPRVLDSAMSPYGGEHPLALGPDDVPDMLALATLCDPGPFFLRTPEFGGYFGVRHGGRLVAMAGRRLNPPGFVEISAVSTDPDHRRRGLGELLVRTVVADIVRSDDAPFLHATRANTNAIRLYEGMGFSLRRYVTFRVFRPSDDPHPVPAAP